jgi:hypothetical protein
LPKQAVTSVLYSGASAAGCPGRTVPPCPEEGGAKISDEAVIVVFDLPVVTWGAADELALLAVIDANPEDRAQSITSTNPAGPDELSVLYNVLNDNNVALWTTEEPINSPGPQPPDQCPTWLTALLILLGALALVLLVWIVYHLLYGNQPPAWLIVFFMLVAALLAWLYWVYSTTPACQP